MQKRECKQPPISWPSRRVFIYDLRKTFNARVDKILGLALLVVTDLKDGPYRLGKALHVKLHV